MNIRSAYGDYAYINALFEPPDMETKFDWQFQQYISSSSVPPFDLRWHFWNRKDNQ